MLVGMKNKMIRLAPPERTELKRRAASRSLAVEDVRRAKLMLLLAAGRSYSQICAKLACTDRYISNWKKRFLARRIAGLASAYKGRKAQRLTVAMRARILAATAKPPTDGSTHWSTRRLGGHLKASHSLVARAWRQAGIKPQRMRRYMASDDPQFESKAADVIGLYLNPPTHAAVFCVDEKSAIQALDRLDPVLPLSPGRAERHGFEYYRHGTLSLYAALETATGEILGKTAARHTSAEFVDFLEQLIATQPAQKQIHIIADNLSAHKTKLVEAFLAQHPNVRLHYTPTYSSWLNQVENWFSKLQRHVIARGVFSSVSDLAKKLMRYIRHYNKTATPIRWIYDNPAHRMTGAIRATDTLH